MLNQTLKSNKGITLITLIITIVVLLIITTTGIYTSIERLKINDVKNMFTDIELLEDKTSEYYITNEKLPVLQNNSGEEIIFADIQNVNGANNLRIIDLSKLNGISLSFGKDFEKIDKTLISIEDTNKDLYVINTETFQIFYAKGIKANGIVYYSKETKNKGEIISGLSNETEELITEVVEGEKIPETDVDNYDIDYFSYYCRARIRCKFLNNKIEQNNNITISYARTLEEDFVLKGNIPSNSVITLTDIGYYEIKLDNKMIAKIKLVHKWREYSTKQIATCAQEGVKIRTCEVCGIEESKTDNDQPLHTYQDWKIIKEATCEENGVKEKTCTVCGYIENEEILKTGHTFGEWGISKEPTCAEEGIKERTCTKCNKKETIISDKTANHTFGDWNSYTTINNIIYRARRCTICGLQETEATKWKIGDVVLYDSNLDTEKERWFIHTANKEGIEIISANTMGSLALSFTDESAQNVNEDLDGDGTVGDSGDKGMYSYNNAIKRINEYCDEIVTATDNDGVRSIGVTIEEDKEKTTITTSATAPYFVKFYKGKSEIKYTLETSEKAVQVEDLKEYWIASRRIENGSIAVYGSIRYSGGYKYLWKLNSNGKIQVSANKLPVRPIVKNPINIEHIGT